MLNWWKRLQHFDNRDAHGQTIVHQAAVKHVTAGALDRAGAPADQVDLFRVMFPNGVGMTLEQALASVVLGRDLDWYIRECLSPDEQAEYKAIQQGAEVEYRIVERKAWKNKCCIEWEALSRILK